MTSDELKTIRERCADVTRMPSTHDVLTLLAEVERFQVILDRHAARIVELEAEVARLREKLGIED